MSNGAGTASTRQDPWIVPVVLSRTRRDSGSCPLPIPVPGRILDRVRRRQTRGLVPQGDTIFWPCGTRARFYRSCGAPAPNRLALSCPGARPVLALRATRPEFPVCLMIVLFLNVIRVRNSHNNGGRVRDGNDRARFAANAERAISKEGSRAARTRTWPRAHPDLAAPGPGRARTRTWRRPDLAAPAPGPGGASVGPGSQPLSSRADRASRADRVQRRSGHVINAAHEAHCRPPAHA